MRQLAAWLLSYVVCSISFILTPAAANNNFHDEDYDSQIDREDIHKDDALPVNNLIGKHLLVIPWSGVWINYKRYFYK